MSAMSERLRRLERFAPLSGVVAVVLWLIAIIVLESGDRPGTDAAAEEFATYFQEESGRILAGGFLFMLGAAVFLWFLGSLRARIHAAEGPVGRLASIVFASGIVITVMGIGLAAPNVAGAFAADERDAGIEPAAAQVFEELSDGFFVGGEAAAVVFFLAAAVAGLRTGALPTWLAWASVVLGIAALLPWIGWAVFIWGLPLWVLVTSIWMFLRPVAPAHARAEPVVT